MFMYNPNWRKEVGLHVCHFCHKPQSVKYFVETIEDGEQRVVRACNRCVTKHASDVDFLPKSSRLITDEKYEESKVMEGLNRIQEMSVYGMNVPKTDN